TLLVAAAGVLLFVAGYTVAARDRLFDLLSGVTSRRAPAASAGTAEVALHEARQAVTARRYDDARRALARIPAGDPLRPQADVLGRAAGAGPGPGRDPEARGVAHAAAGILRPAPVRHARRRRSPGAARVPSAPVRPPRRRRAASAGRGGGRLRPRSGGRPGAQ